MSKQLTALATMAAALATAATALSDAATDLAGGAVVKDEGAGDAKTTTTKKTPATKAKGYEAKHTKAEMQALVTEVKEKKGVKAAKAIVSEAGYEKMAEVEKAEDIDKLYALAEAALGEGGDDDDDSDV